jgi:hypothetical protein
MQVRDSTYGANQVWVAHMLQLLSHSVGECLEMKPMDSGITLGRKLGLCLRSQRYRNQKKKILVPTMDGPPGDDTWEGIAEVVLFVTERQEPTNSACDVKMCQHRKPPDSQMKRGHFFSGVEAQQGSATAGLPHLSWTEGRRKEVRPKGSHEYPAISRCPLCAVSACLGDCCGR